MDAPLDLIINGRFLSQRMTGVQRVAREFVRALDQATFIVPRRSMMM